MVRLDLLDVVFCWQATMPTSHHPSSATLKQQYLEAILSF
jgi:hypothetical protein